MRRVFTLAFLAASALPSLADEPCGLCAREVVMTSSLAKCFLSQYEALEASKAPAVVVDLSACGAASTAVDRGVVEALPSPMASTPEPELEFLVARSQLECLKEKLEQPGLVLDPAATIKLDACNGQTNGEAN